MGGKSTTSTQSVSIPPEVMARYNAVNARAENVAATPFQQYGGQFVAPLSQTQQAGIQNTSSAAGAAQPYYGAATGLTLAGAQDVGPLTGRQIGQYMDPFVGSVVAPTLQALQQQQGQERSQLQTQAIKSGAYGGDRAGLERANLARQQGLGTAQAIAPLLSQAYGQAVQTAQGQQGVQAADLARRMQAGQQLAGLGTGAQQAALQGAQAQIGAGTLEQQTQQADLTARYQQFLQERGYDFQVAQFLANIAMGTGALSGSTTTTTQPAGFFSDERLKDNIEPIGKTFDGQPIYRYDYGDGRTQLGLIAQDVLERGKPGVGMDKSGYLTVNYRDATDDAAAMASMGGAVEEPGNYERGGYVGGGLVGSEDIKSILASQAQAFAPFSQAGLYGGQGAGAGTPGGSGVVPSAKLPVPKLVTAAGSPAQPASGMSQAISTGKGITDLYKGGKELKADVQNFFKKEEPAKPSSAAAPTAAVKPGLKPDAPAPGAKPAMFEADPNTPQGVYVPGGAAPAAENISEAANAVSPEELFDMGGAFSYGGLVPRHHYDEGGPVEEEATMPYGNDAMGNNADIIGDVVKAGTPQNLSLPKPGGGGGSGGKSGGIGSDLMQAGQLAMMGAKAAPMIAEGFTALMAALPFSDARLKHNIEPVGKTFDGQNIYRYDMGDGKTQIGLMAQEVLKRHPDAVGERDGYLTLDYDRATEDASPFAYGGLVPRQAHADGEAVIPDYSAEADLPAVGAIETSSKERSLEDPTLGLIAKHEGFRERPYWDVNALRTGFGSDTVTMPDGTVKRVDKDTSVTVEDAKRDLARRAGEYQGQIKGLVGEDVWGGLDPNAQAALTSVTYNYGRLPKSVVEAAKSGDRAALASAVNALGTHNEGINARRRSQEAGLIDPEGKYDPVMGRPIPPGFIGRKSADLPAEGASEAQYRNQEPGLIDSIGDKLTSERYMVPALSFLGSMLASKSPFLGQAIGEGLVGGVAGYQSMQKQQMEMAKNLIDVVGNRFERQIVDGNVVYRNKLTGAEVPAGQMQSTIYNMFKKAGLQPEQYGVLPPGAPTAPGAAGAVMKTAEAGKPAGPAGGAPAPAEAKAAAPAAAKPLTEMNETQLRRYIENNPEQFGLIEADDPRAIRSKIAALKGRAEDYRTKLNDNAAAQEADRQAQVEQARLDGLLEAAAKQQSAVNTKLNEQQAKQAGDYENEILRRDELFKRAENNWKRLGDIYQDFTTGRATNFKAELASWAEGLNLPLPNLDKKLADAANYDAAMKITMQEVYDAMARENLVRAPAASAKGLSQTVPGANLTPGAVYEIIGKNLGEMNYVKQRDQAYLEQARGTSPVRFISSYDAKNPYNLKEQVARGLSQVPVSKDTPRETIDSLYRTYGPYGYKPMGAEEAPAKQAAPAIPEPLRGMEGLVFSPSRNQYRDAQGNIYDATGKRVQ